MRRTGFFRSSRRPPTMPILPAAISSSRRCSRISRCQENGHREGRNRAEVFRSLCLQHLDDPDHIACQEFGEAEELHRHPFLLAGRPHDACRDHPRQEDRGQGACSRDRLCARNQEDTDRRQRHARLLRQPLRAALYVGSLPDADRGRAGADDRKRRQDGRHAGRTARADGRDGHRPCAKDHEADHPRSRRESRRCQADGLDQHAGRYARSFRPQERQGLLRLSAKAGQEEAVARPQGSLSAEAPRGRGLSRNSSSASWSRLLSRRLA